MTQVLSTERILLDAAGVRAKIAELAEAMALMLSDPSRGALAGVKTRGAVLAGRVGEHLRESRGWNLPLASIDITLHRDDLSQRAPNPLVHGTNLDFDIEGRDILLFDDVLYTGRTIRSAMDELVDFGRPGVIRLGALVDRGLREFPIQPDFAAMTIPTRRDEEIIVRLAEVDGRDEIVLLTPAE